MLDIQLLRTCRTRTDFNRIRSAVKIDSIDKKTATVLRGVERYYKKNPSHGQIDFSLFIPFFERNVAPDMDDEDKKVFKNIIKTMAKNYPDQTTRASILESVLQHNLMHKARTITERYAEGEDVDLISEFSSELDAYKTAVGISALPEVSENIDELIDDMGNDSGVQWRLKSLRAAMRGLRGGDFGIIAARPDQGKTSFLCSELTYMAPQLPAGRPILWLNNEGPGFAIRPRLMQAALNITMTELIAMKEAGTLYDAYFAAVGGEGKIRVMDIHGANIGQVEGIIEHTSPGLIVYDMIDNVSGFGDAQRMDLRLERLYQWAREKAVKYDAIALATSQISEDGANMHFPGLSNLKDSKTGKQGACEFQLMIGSMERDPMLANRRWLSLPKNKLRRVKSQRLQEEVEFDRDRARYKDMGYVDDMEVEAEE